MHKPLHVEGVHPVAVLFLVAQMAMLQRSHLLTPYGSLCLVAPGSPSDDRQLLPAQSCSAQIPGLSV